MLDIRPGNKVRIISNPSKIGVLTGKTIVSGNRKRLEVVFSDRTEFYPEGAIEEAPQDNNPFEIIESGRFGNNGDLRRSLTYHRLSGKLANLIYSLNTTNTEFFAYQFKPVLNFLESPCNGLLIADEVGLGKTIEAGLVWTEIRSRYDARRLLILCPAMLCPKWQRELQDRFGIDAIIASASEILKHLHDYREGRKHDFALIASIQGLRPPSGWNEIKEDSKVSDREKLARLLQDQAHDDPLFDMVVIDEAHYLRNPETKSAKLGELLRAVSDNLLLLSATPIQVKSRDLFQLLHLLDEDTFAHESLFDMTLEANEPLIQLRDMLLAGDIEKELFLQKITEARRHILLNSSEQLKKLEESPPSDEILKCIEGRVELADRIDRINPLSKVISRTRKRDVHERRVYRDAYAYKADMAEVEQKFYSEVTQKVRQYCAKRDVSEGFLLTIPQRQMCSSMAAACKAWQHRLVEDNELQEIVWELNGGDDIKKSNTNTIKPLIQELALIARELGDYDELKRCDSKYSELLKQIKLYWDFNPDHKIVLFSYFRGTLNYLKERLAEDNIQSLVLMGGLDKEAILEEFENSQTKNILLSSEVASEGVDLQFSSLLVNYDLPWNPMKIEQRIGRIDRIGQKEATINIWNIFCHNTLDEKVYDRLFDRLGIFEKALGSIETILGDEIFKMSYELLSHDLSPEKENEIILQTEQAIIQNQRQSEQLENQAVNLIAHGQYIQEKVKAAQDLQRFIDDEDLFIYFKDFLEIKYPGCEIIRTENNKFQFDIKLTSEARLDIQDFFECNNLLGKTKLNVIADKHYPQFLFENKLKRAQPGIEIISQYHPVIRFISESIKLDEKSKPFPISAVSLDRKHLPSNFAKGVYVFAVQRWLFSGERETERLAFKAYPFQTSYEDEISRDEAERLVTLAALKGEQWIDAPYLLDPNKTSEIFNYAYEALEASFEDVKESIHCENDDRINFQMRILESHKQRQSSKIIEKINALNMSGKTKIIPAEQGKLRKLEQRILDKKAILERKRNFTAEPSFVTGGVIQIV